MENRKLYIITSLISLILMIPSCIWECNALNLLSGIGCSGIAASIMAIFIELNSKKKEELSLANARNIYFKHINSQLNMIFERIIWFDARMNEPQFDWSLPPEEYSSFKYIMRALIDYKTDEKPLSFEEAKKRLKEIGEKYSFEKRKEMTSDEQDKTQKMFLIIAYSGTYLINEANQIKENKLALGITEYLPMDKIDSLLFDISLGISMMCSPDKNYSVAIDSLLSAAKIIRETGQYTDSIRIGLHGSVQMSEL